MEINDPSMANSLSFGGLSRFPSGYGWVGVGGAEKVCPLEDFGETELVEGDDDGSHGLFAADDEDFDGFSVGVGVGVEFEGEVEEDHSFSKYSLI